MARQIAVAVVLAVAALFTIVAAVGVVRSKNNLAALHCAGVANVLAPILAMIAVLIDIPAGQSTVKMAVLTVVLMIGAPVTTHAIAVAEHRRNPRR